MRSNRSTFTGAPATGWPERSTTAAWNLRASFETAQLSGLMPMRRPAFHRATRLETVWISPLGSRNSISAVMSCGASAAGRPGTTVRAVPAESSTRSTVMSFGLGPPPDASPVSSCSPRRTRPSLTGPLPNTKSSKPSNAGRRLAATSARSFTGSSPAPPPAKYWTLRSSTASCALTSGCEDGWMVPLSSGRRNSSTRKRPEVRLRKTANSEDSSPASSPVSSSCAGWPSGLLLRNRVTL